VTIARRRLRTIEAIPAAMGVSQAMPATAPLVVPRPAFPVPFGDVPAQDTITPAGRLRRCTFRRVDRAATLPGRAGVTAYEAMCLYGSSAEPLALGDLESARAVCESCTAAGIFRPDED
jgi:hypothetical protein